MLTLTEYLVDYAPAHTAEKGWELIEKELEGLKLADEKINVAEIRNRIEKIKQGERDLYF